MTIPEVTKIVLGELTIAIPTATPLAMTLAQKLDRNQDGIVSVEDVPDEQIKTPYDEEVHGSKADILIRTVASTFVKEGIITGAQKKAFTYLPSVYSEVKRFNKVGTEWLNSSRKCMILSCRTFEPKAWQSVVSEVSNASSPFRMDSGEGHGQSFLFSLFYVIQGLTVGAPQYGVSFGQECGEYSAVYYDLKSINPVLRPVFSEITQLYSPVATELGKSAGHSNRITMECKGDCDQYPQDSFKLVYPFKLAAADKNDAPMDGCPNN